MSKTITGAQFVISRVGGLTKTAKALSEKLDVRVPVTTVQGWRERNRIPQEYWTPLIDLAEANGLPVSLADFLVDHEVDDEPEEALQAAS
jgi:predicted DNA-binding ribbon-helix-helix protein